MKRSADVHRATSRRRFIQTTIAGSAGLIVAPSFFPRTYLFGARRRRPAARITDRADRLRPHGHRGPARHDQARPLPHRRGVRPRLEAARSGAGGGREVLQGDKGESASTSRRTATTTRCWRGRTSTPCIVTPPDHWHAHRRGGGGPGRQGPARPEAAHLRHRRGHRAAHRGAREEAHPADRAASSGRRSPGTRSGWRARPCATAASARSRPSASASARTSRRARRRRPQPVPANLRLRDVARPRAAAAVHGGPRPPADDEPTAGPAGSPPRTSASA